MKLLSDSQVLEISGGAEWVWLNDAARAVGSATAGAVDYMQNLKWHAMAEAFGTPH